ncbi:nuclease-related domain-containing protein [Bacillus sp. FJAT-27251]|uniref:nuclease-related domain-containing protein n=1 Tax=Bacillus sp. FJAT-27251 TaxID=1684142 RepID=UPI001E41FAA2|nr:nuclease-related domain-containing protein [Bacillus sp. FJAT-27251]
MIIKERKESDELLTMRYLNTRKQLTEKDKSRYVKLEKGYEGEVQFDTLTENLSEERYILNDLLLEANNSHFQIDSTVVSQGTIYLLDLKILKEIAFWIQTNFTAWHPAANIRIRLIN